ncbi:SEC-C metal-binding domain-containing protein [Sorangium sp. So ce119]|uniref:YecA family protein n=1 Tax=Sorangium sp. So ce119 TaxID=3133279 RepID=UPI003F642945
MDLALELYRDPELLRAVLDAATLPERVERVAISLDDPVQGPFLVVTRNGHFVTCLGRGMRAGDLPIVKRGELDTISRQVTRLREKMVLAKQLGGERGHARLLRRLLVASDSVSREEFLAVAAWEPLLGPVFLDLYLAMGRELSLQGPMLRTRRSRRAQDEEVLHAYWNLLHAAGHMALLGAITADREQYVSLTHQHRGARAAFSYPLTGTGVVTFILKGAWAAARLGRLMLPDYKQALAEDVSFFELLDTLFALLAIGIRAKGTRAEISKALRAAPGTARTPQAKRLRDAMGREVQLCCEITAQLLEAPAEELEATLRRVGERYFEPDATNADDPIREELVRTLPLMSWADGITDGKKLLLSLHLIAATARRTPEQFYLPGELAEALHEPWTPAKTWMVLDPLLKADQAGRRRDASTASIGRQHPCPCGSGRKWKRCCGK